MGIAKRIRTQSGYIDILENGWVKDYNGRNIGSVDSEGHIMDINGVYVGRIDASGDICNKSGKYLGSVSDSVLRDRNGTRVSGLGILCDDTSSSQKTIDESSYSQSDHNKTTHTAIPLSGGSGTGSGAGIILVVAAIFFIITFRSIPEHLNNMVIAGTTEFYAITVPVLADILILIIALIKNGARKLSEDGGLILFIMTNFTGLIVYAVVDLVVFIISYISDPSISIVELIIMYICILFMYLSTYMLILLIGSIMVSAILSFSRIK